MYRDLSGNQLNLNEAHDSSVIPTVLKSQHYYKWFVIIELSKSKGLPLHYSSESSLVSAHWSMRYTYSETMIPQINSGQYFFSEFTLALMVKFYHDATIYYNLCRSFLSYMIY